MQIVSGGRACTLARGPALSEVTRKMSPRRQEFPGGMLAIRRISGAWGNLLYFGRLDTASPNPAERILCGS